MHSDTLFSQLDRLEAEGTSDVSRQQGGAGCSHTEAKAPLSLGGRGVTRDSRWVAGLFNLPVFVIIHGMPSAGDFCSSPLRTYREPGLCWTVQRHR